MPPFRRVKAAVVSGAKRWLYRARLRSSLASVLYPSPNISVLGTTAFLLGYTCNLPISLLVERARDPAGSQCLFPLLISVFPPYRSI
ncbi:uncharacterized protein LAESUDRAFT_719387 [Laetiporus sulphureus 93-53]|uniref:Uncharacterized protein n=1 Tax=Laetiporus sulphureus 93-53 TaxID=1314785 RepID=A0A165IH86_9APHY|nr:uncharacterized protein LAESUDRAFT_719387 [Laetiporus sulphureus 93-53]KZT13069.1 hypothetical protein LAESUDRAFT_719387 [Laetiporus sulphureus 93-53]